jgi:hypothetical protein
MRPKWLMATTSASLFSLMLTAGCDQNGTNAGLTNGPPPAEGEKAAGRDDLPGAIGSGRGEALGAAGDSSTNSGTGGMGGGIESTRPDQPKTGASANSDSVRANPPAKAGGDANSAGGGTKPPDQINTGTPRSPQ